MNNKKLLMRLIPIVGISCIIIGYIYIVITGMRLDTNLKEKENELKVKQEMCDSLDKVLAQKIEANKVLEQAKESLAELATENNPGAAPEVDSVIACSQREIYDIDKSTDLSFQVTPRKERDSVEAKKWENKGLACLKKKDVLGAIEAYTKSENAYNGYRSVYEIAIYLEKNKEKLLDPASPEWAITYAKFDADYGYSLSPKIKTELQNKAGTPKIRTGFRKR